MMGGAAFFLLKAGIPGPESAKQAEIRFAILPKILGIGRSGPAKFARRSLGAHAMVVQLRIPLGMANWPTFGRYVIQITVFAEKMAQYPARRCRLKLMKVTALDYLLPITWIHRSFSCGREFILGVRLTNTMSFDDSTGQIFRSGSAKCSC
jgi:hypothetical protein